VERYFYYGAAPFLKSIGFANKYLMPVLSLGQISEILAMLITGFLIKKFGYRIVMIFGLIMELLKLSALFFGYPVIFLLTGLFVHGFAYAFYFIPFIILLDSYCSKTTRIGVHQLSTVFTMGFGNLAGNLIAGAVMGYATVNSVVDYQKFWLVPIIITAVSFIIPIFFIKQKDKDKISIQKLGP
jgi:MFS family permease